MTKTSKVEAKTPDGRDGFQITCTCTSHNGANSAIVAFPIATSRIHGTVLLANHPAKIMRIANERKGIWAC